MSSIFNFDNNLKTRYMTLIQTIKTATNTFYDAYNNFIEGLLKIVAKDNGIDLKFKGSITTLIDNKVFYSLLNDTFLMEESQIKKIKDYALKINKHKHNLEKGLEIDTVIKYMRVLYDLIDKINRHYHFKAWHIDVENYILSIYNTFEKSITNLKKDLVKVSNLNEETRFDVRMLYWQNTKAIYSSFNNKIFELIQILIIIIFGIIFVFNATILAFFYPIYVSICGVLIFGYCLYGLPILFLCLKILFSHKFVDFDICIKQRLNPFYRNRLGYYYNSNKLNGNITFTFLMGEFVQVFFFAMCAAYNYVILTVLSGIAFALLVILYFLIKAFYLSYQKTIIYVRGLKINLNPENGMYQVDVAGN